MIKKHLIFHFFIPDDYETNVAIKMHYACLWRYSKIFDSAEFFIVHTADSEKYVDSVKQSLLNIIQVKDIRLKVVENDLFCEGRTLKENIVDKLDCFNETFIFFGHTKGITNITNYKGMEDHFLKWIHALYFYSLEFIEEVELKLEYAYAGRRRAFFGPLMTVCNDVAMYPGAFFWLNPMMIKNDVHNKEVSIPKLADRTYSEGFPTIYKYFISGGYQMGKVDGHNSIVSNLEDFDLYFCDMDEVIRYYGDYDKFIENYNELMSEIQ